LRRKQRFAVWLIGTRNRCDDILWTACLPESITLGYVLEVERGMEAQWKLSIARESSCLGILSEVNFSSFQRNATHYGIDSMDDCDLWHV